MKEWVSLPQENSDCGKHNKVLVKRSKIVQRMLDTKMHEVA